MFKVSFGLNPLYQHMTASKSRGQMKQLTNKLKNAIQPIASIALITILMLVFAEATVRLSAFLWSDYGAYYFFYGFGGLNGKLGVSPWSTHTGAYYKFPPNYQLQGAAGQADEIASINSLGFRGPEFQPVKPKGTFRIFCLGGSSTFGYRNSDGGTYPLLLEKILRQSSGDTNIEVINAGFPYYNTSSVLALLREELSRYNPDLITLYAAFNDAAWPLNVNVFSRALFWIQEHSAVYLLIKEIFHTDSVYFNLISKIMRVTRPKVVNYEPFKKEIDQVALRFRENVKTIVRFSKEKGIAVVLVKQPMTAGNRESDSAITYEGEYQAVMEKFRAGAFLIPNQLLLIKHHRLIEELEKIAKEEGLDIVDNIAIVDRHRGGLASWVHLTEEANLRLAEALKPAIETHIKSRHAHTTRQTGVPAP
jgi:lysophospholipase L1-like esterase